VLGAPLGSSMGVGGGAWVAQPERLVPAALPAQGSSMESAGSSGLIWRGIQLVWHISSVHPLMTSREVSLRRYSACSANGTAAAG
jgi:hypothetical protein